MFGDGVFDGGILVSGGDGVLGVWGGLGKVWIMVEERVDFECLV